MKFPMSVLGATPAFVVSMRRSVQLGGALALAALALLAGGCGPTTGGTGTGGSAPIPLSTFGATAANVCSASFAASIGCTTSTGLAPEPGSALASGGVYFVGSNAAGPFVLTLLANSATLQSRCRATSFSGEYGVLAADPAGEGRYFGRYVAADRSEAAASMAVQAVAPPSGGRSDTLQLLVRSADGGALFGPLQLTRSAAAPTDAPQCP